MTETTPLTVERFDFTMSKFEIRFNEKIDILTNRVEENLSLLHAVIADTGDIKKRVTHLEQSMDDVQYSLSTLTNAEEKDAKATINHELRLQGLEKVTKIKATSPAHLIDIQA